MSKKKIVFCLQKDTVPCLKLRSDIEKITRQIMYTSKANRDFSEFRKISLTENFLNGVYSVLLDKGLITNGSYACSTYFSDNKARKNPQDPTCLRISSVKFGSSSILILWLNLPSFVFINDVLTEIIRKVPDGHELDRSVVFICLMFSVHLIRLKNNIICENHVIYDAIDDIMSKSRLGGN